MTFNEQKYYIKVTLSVCFLSSAEQFTAASESKRTTVATQMKSFHVNCLVGVAYRRIHSMSQLVFISLSMWTASEESTLSFILCVKM